MCNIFFFIVNRGVLTRHEEGGMSRMEMNRGVPASNGVIHEIDIVILPDRQ
jgi:hypothetical protein